MLDVVGHKITQREAVMCGHEIYARSGWSAVAIKDVGGAGEPLRQLADAVGVAAPEVADMVSETIVPFAPARPEGAHLVAIGAHVPRLGDDLDLAEHGIFANRLLEWMILIDMMAFVPDQGGCKIEAKTVHTHLSNPVAQRIQHHAQYAGFGCI